METTADQTPHSAPVTSLGTPVDDDGELTRVHPNYVWVLRLRALFTAIPVLIGSLVLETALSAKDGWPLPQGSIAISVLVLAAIIVIRFPSRRYAARGYQISADRLRVVRGILFRADTVVPFSRVQHIDVDQGPLERFFGIATLTLHTAGNHNASVHLPGLQEDLARDMREEIRSHIKRESV
jgi:membrane protein YdbS with pleckstrin-like domain